MGLSVMVVPSFVGVLLEQMGLHEAHLHRSFKKVLLVRGAWMAVYACPPTRHLD
jgi:hypothetical protein